MAQNSFCKQSIFAIFCLIFSHVIVSSYTDFDPLLVLTIMVKNEEHSMEKTLEPFLELRDPRIGYLILDTGSTDNTISVTLDLFQKYDVTNGYVVEKPFVNFAVSRNDAIKFAEEKFPYAGFLLMIDAEWFVQGVSDLLDFCEEYKFHSESSFLLKIGNKSFENFLPRLFKPHKGLYFEGVVHEYLNARSCIKIDNSVMAIYAPSNTGREQSQRRWTRDANLLFEEHKRNPTDPRTTFYLAQTYACLGDLKNALYWYQFRTQQPGWDQENYMAFYRLATVYEGMGDWPNALFNYIKAYSMRPCRVEPLVAIASHYLHVQDFVTSFMFARQACEVEFSPSEVLFVDKVFYEYTRYDLLGIAAWYVGQYEIGEKAVKKALEYNPELTHLKNNLSLYESKRLQK
jgi:tetratricopeptide (TPR) repeat protein